MSIHVRRDPSGGVVFEIGVSDEEAERVHRELGAMLGLTKPAGPREPWVPLKDRPDAPHEAPKPNSAVRAQIQAALGRPRRDHRSLAANDFNEGA